MPSGDHTPYDDNDTANTFYFCCSIVLIRIAGMFAKAVYEDGFQQ
jgi:hypothetical protein